MPTITAASGIGQITDLPTLTAKLSDYLGALNDVVNGKLEFGSNLKSQTVSVAFGAANTDVLVRHNLNKTGVLYVVGTKSAAGEVFTGKTAATSQALYLQTNTANLNVTLVLF